MVSVLTRIFGFDDIEMAEDVVQESMYKALQEWPYHGIPDNPSAWLYKVAQIKPLIRCDDIKGLFIRQTTWPVWHSLKKVFQEKLMICF